MKRKSLYFGYSLLLLALLACSPGKGKDGSEGEGTLRPDGIINSRLVGKIVSMDPVIAGGDAYSARVVAPVFDTLYSYDYFAPGYPLVPLVATDFPQISEDGLTYTFSITPGIYYYDPRGEVFAEREREIRAEDFVLSIMRLADLSQKGKGYWLLSGFVQGLDEWRSASENGGDYENLPAGVRILGDYEFEIELTKPFPQLLYVLEMAYTAPLPKEMLEYYGINGMTNRIIGSGPYYLDPEQTIDDNRYVYKVNPTFREQMIDSPYAPDELQGQKLPLNGGINVRLIEESAPAWLAFQQGELDIFTPGKDQFDQAVVNNELTPEMVAKGITLTITPTADVTYRFINFDDPEWGPLMNDVEVGPRIRKAIQLAYDNETITEVLYNNRAVPAISPIPPTFSGFEEFSSEYSAYDPERAKQLLSEAGYPNGEGLPLLRYEAASASKTSRDFYEFTQRYLAEIGIETEFIVNDWPTFVQKLDDGKFQFAGIAWGADYPDPQNFLQLFYGPNVETTTNSVRYRSPEFDALYEKAAPMIDSPERTELYLQMVKILDEDHPWIYGVHRLAYSMTTKRLRNYRYNEFINSSAPYLQIVE